MAATSLLTAVTVASVVVATVGTRKVYKTITAERGITLPSLSKYSQKGDSAYPENYYPGGEYADLSFGETHYYLFGPEDGKKIVFVHGLSSPAPVYNTVARHMAENGCRVLLYDLYSRGYSVGPHVDHDPLLYVTQLHELLLHVGWGKCNFVGYSLGGAIISCYSHRFSESVQSLTFISPGGLLSASDLPWVAKIFLIPYSVEILSKNPVKNYFSKKNVESMLNEFKDDVPTCIKEAAKIMELQFEHHAGYARGLMSTLKIFPLTGLDVEYATCQQQTYPVQVIWGTKDTVIPGTTITKLHQLVPRIKATNVEGATHSIVMTHPKNIIEKLEGFVC